VYCCIVIINYPLYPLLGKVEQNLAVILLMFLMMILLPRFQVFIDFAPLFPKVDKVEFF